MARQTSERTRLRLALRPSPYKITARKAVGTIWANSRSGRPIILKAFQTVSPRVRPDLKWPGLIIAVILRMDRPSSLAFCTASHLACCRNVGLLGEVVAVMEITSTSSMTEP